MSTFARINEFGFIETPYRKIVKGVCTKKIEYLTADQEESHLIAQANNPVDDKGNFTTARITVRYRGDFLEVRSQRGRLHGCLSQAIGLRGRQSDPLP